MHSKFSPYIYFNMSVVNPLDPAGSSTQGCWKRNDSEEDENFQPKVKKAKYWHIRLESESPQPTSSDEDDESIYSVQALETEFVQDTSDISTLSWVYSTNNVVHLEYEVASPSGNENPFIDDLTSSDPDVNKDIISAGVIVTAICNSDVDLADDRNDSISSRDSEINRANYWTCGQCNNSNNNPLFRYCQKCYQARKHVFPPRPKGKRRRTVSKKSRIRTQLTASKKLAKMNSGFGIDSEKLTNLKQTGQTTSISYFQESVNLGFSSCLCQPSSSLLSQTGSSSVSQEKSSTIVKNNEEEQTHKMIDSGKTIVGSQESQCSIATTMSIGDTNFDLLDSSQDVDPGEKIGLSLQKAKSLSDADNKFCLICTIGPKNGAFVHGRNCHICCCYRCTMKVWKTTKHCPICNRKVTDVIKAYYA